MRTPDEDARTSDDEWLDRQVGYQDRHMTYMEAVEHMGCGLAFLQPAAWLSDHVGRSSG